MAFISKIRNEDGIINYFLLTFPFCSFQNARTFNKYSIKHVISNFHESLNNSKVFPRRCDESTLKGCTALARQIFSRDVLLLAVSILLDVKDLCVGRLSRFWIHLNSSWNAASSLQLQIYAAVDYH